MIDPQTKRLVEKTLRANGFGQGTSKRIVSLVCQAMSEEKGKEPMRGKGSEDRRR